MTHSAGSSAEGADWTVDPETGRSNSSEKFLILVAAVEGYIRNSGWALVNGGAEGVARLIVAKLAHEHGLKP